MRFNKVKLKELCSFQEGYVNPKQTVHEYFDGGIKWLRATDINDTYIYNTGRTLTEEGFKSAGKSAKLFKPNTIAISKSGTIGRVGIIKDYMCGNRAVINIVPNEEQVELMYLYYYLKMNRSVLESMAQGSVQKNLYIFILEEFEINIPDLEEQSKIVKILSSIDNKIELNNQINNNLYELSNKLFEKYFINNVNNNMKECSLSELIDVINGYSYKGSELVENSNIGMVTIKNFERTGGFKSEGFKSIIPTKVKKEQYVDMYDILVACTDLTQAADIIGNAIMLLDKNLYDEIVLSMDLVKIVPKNEKMRYVIYAVLNSKEFKNHALGYKSGTTVLHLNKQCFKDFEIRLPSTEILDKFSLAIESNYKKMSDIITENNKLEVLRDTLLPKLMSGEIDLDNIEI